MRQFSMLLILLVFLSQNLFSQEIESEKKPSHFAPIVHVFGNANYSFENNHYNFVLGRAHLGGKYTFNKSWSAKIILDRGRPTTINNFTFIDTVGNKWNVSPNFKDGAYYTMWLKFASVKWQISQDLSIETGAILQNHYITQEQFWGHRFVAQTFQDMYWGIPSSDLGFIARYRLNNCISFDAALTNGEGLREEQDSEGRIKLAFGLDLTPFDMMKIRLYSHFRQSPVNDSDEYLFSAFAGCYVSNWMRIGGEINYISNQYFMSDAISYGTSVYAVADFLNKFDAYLRFDMIDSDIPNLENYPNKQSVAYILGLSYEPVKNVRFSLNQQNWQYKNQSENKNLLGFSFEYKFADL